VVFGVYIIHYAAPSMGQQKRSCDQFVTGQQRAGSDGDATLMEVGFDAYAEGGQIRTAHT
jgi:hypothetical protein